MLIDVCSICSYTYYHDETNQLVCACLLIHITLNDTLSNLYPGVDNVGEDIVDTVDEQTT